MLVVRLRRVQRVAGGSKNRLDFLSSEKRALRLVPQRNESDREVRVTAESVHSTSGLAGADPLWRIFTHTSTEA